MKAVLACLLDFSSARLVAAAALLSYSLAACDLSTSYNDGWDGSRGGYREPYRDDYRYRDYRHDDYRYDHRDRHYYEHDRRDDRWDHKRDEHHYQAPPPPPPKPKEQVIRPSCPPNTTFDGKHCIIPKNQRRPGGQGTINACPKGMWLSGDRCVPD